MPARVTVVEGIMRVRGGEGEYQVAGERGERGRESVRDKWRYEV